MTTTTIAAGYTRVSTPHQAKEGESLKIQRQAIREYAKARRWKLVEIYSDAGVSGAKKDRPALQTLLQDARDHKFDSLIVHRLSRLGRNARELLNNYHALKEASISVHFVKEQIDSSTTTGRLLLTIMAAIAEMEREIIEEQMTEGRVKKWREGRVFIGTLPLGYHWNKDNKQIEVLRGEADLYLRIVSMYLDEGMSLADIGLKLTEDGIKGRTGGTYKSGTLAYILKNRIYYGHYVVNRHKFEGKSRTGEMKPESEHITLEAPALISKTRWDEIQDRFEFNRRKGKRISPVTKECWLRDVLQCEECDGASVKHRIQRGRKGDTQYRYYCCSWSRATQKQLKIEGRAKCTLPHIVADELEEDIIWRLISHLTLGGKATGEGKSYLDQLADPTRYDRDIQDLDQQIANLQKDLKRKTGARERIYGLLESDEFDKDEMLRQLNRNKDEVLGIEARLVETQEKVQSLEQARENDQLLHDFLRDRRDTISKLQDDLHALSPDDKKVLVESMVSGYIRVAKKGDKGWWVPPFSIRFNRPVLEQFIKDGKLSSLSKNNGDHSYRPRRRTFRG